MDTFTETYGIYRMEFEKTLRGLRHWGLTIQKKARQFLVDARVEVHSQKQKLIEVVCDTSDVKVPYKAVVGTFAWASILILGASIGSFLGSFLLDFFLSCMLGKFGAGLIAFLIIPTYAYNTIKKDEAAGVPDTVVRFSLLFLAIIQGILVGHIISSSYLSAQPPAFVIPAIIALTFPPIAHSIGTNRVFLLCGVLGTTLILNLLLGVVAGYLTAPYFLLTILYVLSAAITLQFVFQSVEYNEGKLYACQLALWLLFVLVKSFVFLVFGSRQYAESFKNNSRAV